jgi:DNA-binding MarR family transcriptional regulator
VIPAHLHSTSLLTEGAPDLQVWRAIFKVNVCLSRQLDQQIEAEHGLSLSSLQALICVDEAPEGRMRMSDLAEAAGLSRSGVTRLADRLERDGLLCRDRCCDDARGAFACLTDAGREKVVDGRTTYQSAVSELLSAHLSDHEREVITTALERIGRETLGGCGCRS